MMLTTPKVLKHIILMAFLKTSVICPSMSASAMLHVYFTINTSANFFEYDQFIRFCSFFPYLYYANAGLTIVFYPIMVYLIVKYSPKENSPIKYLYLNIVTTSFLLSIAYALWSPVIIGLVSGFSMGLIGQFGAIGSHLFADVDSFCLSNLTTVYLAMLYYLHRAFTSDEDLRLLNRRFKKMAVVYGVFILIHEITIIVSLHIAFRMGNADIRATNDSEIHELSQLLEILKHEQPSLIIYSLVENSWILFYIIIAGSIVTLTVLLIIYFNFKILYRIKKTTKIVTDKTFQMQLVFFRAVFVKSIFTIICFLLPIIILILNALHFVENVYLVIIAGALQPLHVPIGYILMLVLIKPYRSRVFKCLCTRKLRFIQSMET